MFQSAGCPMEVARSVDYLTGAVQLAARQVEAVQSVDSPVAEGLLVAAHGCCRGLRIAVAESPCKTRRESASPSKIHRELASPNKSHRESAWSLALSHRAL